MEQYFKVGKLAASHGLQGDIILQHSLGKKTSLKGIETIFVETTKDNFLPYFISWVKIKSDTEVYIHIEGIDNKEQARKITPKEVWFTAEDFNKYTATASPISLLNYTLYDGTNEVGEIIEVIEQPHQLLCTVMYKGKEAYVPLHDDNIEKIDKKNKKVIVSIPDGLLDVYA